MGARVRRLSAIALAFAVLWGCSSPGTVDQERSTDASQATDLSTLSVEESRQLRGTAAREALEQRRQCLEDRGFPSQQNADGTLTVEVGEQRQAYEQANESCDQEVDYGAAAAPLTDEEIRWLFDENVKAYECLVSEGFSPSEPVSFGVFLADYREGRSPWSPFLPSTGEGSIMTESCPEPDINAQE